MATTRRRGRPPQISRDQIVDAAVEIGLDRFTMSSVATRLNVTTPALYTHVASRDELLALVARQLMEGVEETLPDGYDWRAWLESFARAVRESLGASRMTIIAQMDDPAAAAKVRLAEHGLGVLLGAGFTPADAASAFWLVFRVAITAGPPTSPSIRVQRRMAPELEKPPEDLPNLEAVAAALDREAVVDTFETDLGVVLEGLQARLSRTPTPEPRTPR